VKNKLDIQVGDLVLFPKDKFNSYEQYGMIIEVMPNHFGVPVDDEESLDDGTGYRVEWISNGNLSNDSTIEDTYEASEFRQAFLNKHPNNESY